MKTDNANSGSTSAATSAGASPTNQSRVPSPTAEATAVGKTGAGESAYLTRQQQLASQAMTETLSDITKGITRTVDPRLLLNKHPWATLGASAIAGFAAAAALIPSKEQQALRKLAAIERALHPKPTNHDGNGEAKNGEPHGAPSNSHKSGRSGLMHFVLTEVLSAVKPAIISLLSAGLTASAARPSDEEMRAAAATAGDGGTGPASGSAT